MNKQLATLIELQSHRYERIMKQINEIAIRGGLQEYITYSRIWEYPWLWFQLNQLKGHGLRIIDIGSEKSPFPWFLAMQDFRVTVSDITANYWRIWKKASQQLKVAVDKRILNAQDLDLSNASTDIYLSVSVIEHVPDKPMAIAEAARVLRPGGLLIMTFDICEPDMGMTFPEWNGRSLTMCEFDDLFKNSPWFEPGLSELPWNINDIPEYLSWHRTTASWHNYITGAAIIKRNNRPWVEPAYKEHLRTLKGKWNTSSSVAFNSMQHGMEIIKRGIVKFGS